MIGNNKVYIIAEAGVNHNGSLELAKQLVDKAKYAGANAVKFQTWKTENVITKTAQKPRYQKENYTKGSQFKMLKELELSYKEFIELKHYCDEKKIIFMSTADEYESALFLKDIVPIMKVGSSELTDLPFLKKIAKFNKPILLSTGMATFDEIEIALEAMLDEGLKKEYIVVLHANTAYPTPFEDANLRAISSIREKFNVAVGYSDHTIGIEAAIAAVVLGAIVIEKHFTLDKNMLGPDHKSSINPEEFRIMVNSIRNIEVALGDGIKKLTKSENENVLLVRKSIVSKTRIKKGECFSEDNITIKRPGNGISPKKWFDILGKVATRDFEEDELIEI